MSASSPGIPPLIEQQLLSLDKQIRDVSFIRGAGRLVLGVCLLLGSSLLLDAWLDLSGTIRIGLLGVWIASAGILLWRGLVRPALQPVSFSALAALVEKQFPELSERLTSLVELRGADGDELAPGASSLMQDLLARQTVKALDRVTVDHAASHRGSFRAVMAAAIVALFLLAPFGWNSNGYGLLWARFFVPWGNFGWGSSIDLKVVEGDQIVARGADVNVHVTLTDRRYRRELGKELTRPIWLNWQDENGSSDSRRLDWDDQSQQFLATLPHVRQSLTYEVATSGAKSGTFRVDVSDPPSITQWKMDIEPAAYTGLPAKTLTGIPAEIRVAEFSRIRLSVEFSVAVATAVLNWPVVSDDAPKSALHPEQKVGTEQSIPLELSADRRSGTAIVSASISGSYVIVAKNSFGLQNNDTSRTLTIIPDLPPQIQLDGDDQPILARPDDVVELKVEVNDDYGLSAVELHTETSEGNKQVDSLPADQCREGHVDHTFVLDLSQFDLAGGQAVSYRIRAADNRPHPAPHEVWTPSRTLVINTTLKQLPDREMAQSEQSLEDELSNLRTELNRNKADLAELHQETEKEALDKQAQTDKSERLDQLQNAQDMLIEKMQQLADRLAARRMTHDLAPQAQQIAEVDLAKVQDRLEQAKNQPARDQLEPLSQAIDNLGAADRQLRQLEDQLVDLNKLEQDLAELSRMAQHAERLADQLDKLDAEQRAAAHADQKTAQSQAADDPKKSNRSDDSTLPANKKDARTAQTQNEPGANDKGPKDTARNDTAQKDPNAASPDKRAADEKAQPDGKESRDDSGKKLNDEATRLAEQMRELLKKHPELLEAAKRDQLDQLNDLAEQARKLAGSQDRLADALNEAVAKGPLSATKPENIETQTPAAAKTPDGQAKQAPSDEPASADSPAQAGQPEREKSKPVQPDASDRSNPSKKPSEQNAPNQQNSLDNKADQNSSREKSDQIAGNPTKDPPQKPADATSPSEPGRDRDPARDKDASGNKEKDTAVNKEVENKESAANEKPGIEKAGSEKPAANDPDSKTDPKPTSKQTSNESTKDTKENQAADTSAKSPDAAVKSGKDTENSQANPAVPKAQQTPQTNEQLAGNDVARQQEQIARDATKQAVEMARETGADSNATKAAAEFARKADTAKQQAQTGQLAQAAKDAREAAKSAEETARQLNPDGQSNSPQSKQAQQLADQQNKAAKQMESLAQSADAAQGAQVQGQKQLADATSKLAEQMDRVAKSLKSQPLNSPKEAQAGEKAGQTTKQAEQSMKQAAQANQQNDPQEAAKAASEAADKLKQAANSVPPSPPKKPNSLPVPKNVASQVTEVTKKLENAQKELSSCNCNKPGAGQSSQSGNPGSSPSQGQQSQAQQSQGQQSQGSKPGQGQQDSKAQAQTPQNGQQSQKPQSDKPGDKSGQGQQQAGKSQGDQQGQGQQDSKAQAQSPKNGQQSQKPGDKPGQGQQQAGKSQSDQQGQGQQDSKAQAQSPKNEQQTQKPGDKPGQGQQQVGKSQGDQQGQGQRDSKAPAQSPQNGNQQAQKPQGDQSGQSQQASKAQSQKSGESQGQQISGQPDQSSQVGSSQQTGPSQEPSRLAQVADQFREVAAMLRQTRGDPKENLNAGDPMKANRPGKPMPGQVSQPSEAGDSGSNASGTTATLDLQHLDGELQQLARQNWGRLPGQLRTEILQGAGKKSHPEYTQRIKSYFDEITKPAK